MNTAKPSLMINKISRNFLALACPKARNTDNPNEMLYSFSQKPNVKGVDIVQEDFKPIKKITSMHLKLYESTQQNVKLNIIILKFKYLFLSA